MPSVHYKFRSSVESKVVSFDGPDVLVTELSNLICDAEDINTNWFQLKLLNVNNVEYGLDSRVPSNSIVIVQRVPAINGRKAPKSSNPEQFNPASTSTVSNTVHISSEDFAKMNEIERIQHAMFQSTHKYDPSMYSPKPKHSRIAPATFQCNRCNGMGHYTSSCPLRNVRRTTGIVTQHLVETTADDPERLLHCDGRWMVHKMVMKARETKMMHEERKRNIVVLSPVAKKARVKSESGEVPEELKCAICSSVFRDAVTLRCGDSFCAGCIEAQITKAARDGKLCRCPQCQEMIGIGDLAANKSLREAARGFAANNVETAASEEPKTPSPERMNEIMKLLEASNILNLPSPPTVPSKQQPKSPTTNPPPSLWPDVTPNSSPPSFKHLEVPITKHDKAAIDAAWSLVPVFDREVEITELLTKDPHEMPKLILRVHDKENCHQSRKRHRTMAR
uniref:E3 ubiquitin-protein ligase RBBP6 n=1 Tax=Panagrellus redivivus TaxID=6233 RepID=A0A7E4VFI0_PANRE